AEVAEVCVVGVPDPEWGELVTAVVVPAPGASTSLLALRERAGGGAHPPRALVTLPALPVRGPGKTDRRRAAKLAGEALAAGRGGGLRQGLGGREPRHVRGRRGTVAADGRRAGGAGCGQARGDAGRCGGRGARGGTLRCGRDLVADRRGGPGPVERRVRRRWA